jgi:hypothetical protein
LVAFGFERRNDDHDPVTPDNDDKTKSDAVGQEANFQFSFSVQKGSQMINTSSPNWTSKLSKLTFEQSFQNAFFFPDA